VTRGDARSIPGGADTGGVVSIDSIALVLALLVVLILVVRER
jgi:hypothetical protein